MKLHKTISKLWMYHSFKFGRLLLLVSGDLPNKISLYAYNDQ